MNPPCFLKATLQAMLKMKEKPQQIIDKLVYCELKTSKPC